MTDREPAVSCVGGITYEDEQDQKSRGECSPAFAVLGHQSCRRRESGGSRSKEGAAGQGQVQSGSQGLQEREKGGQEGSQGGQGNGQDPRKARQEPEGSVAKSRKKIQAAKSGCQSASQSFAAIECGKARPCSDRLEDGDCTTAHNQDNASLASRDWYAPHRLRTPRPQSPKLVRAL